MIAVDYETYYDDECTIVKWGYWHYPRHKDFDAYLVSVFGEGLDYAGPVEGFDWSQLDGRELVSHNAAFDESVTLALIQQGKIADFHPAVWEDSADLSAYVSGARSLKDAAKLILGVSLSKDVRDKMKGKRWSSLSPEQQGEVIKYARDDTKYCLEIWCKEEHKWPELERWVSRANRYAGMAGVPVDKQGIRDNIAKAKELIRLAELQIPWADSEDAVILSHKKVAEYCRMIGIEPPASLAEDSPECAQWEETYGGKHKFVAALRQYRKANTILKKLEVMECRTRPDGRMGYELKYFGATTGRFSGSAKFNIQNLPRNDYEGINIRNLIKAGEGKTFITADFSQVEPRCLNWLAGNTALLDKIRQGFGIYEAFAIQNGIWKEGEKGFKKSPLYQMTKSMVLGCGYGMSAGKFVIAAPILTGGAYTPTEAEAERVVSSFKKNNPKIVKLWRKLDKEFKESHLQKENYIIHLPSDRCLEYTSLSSVGGYSAKKTLAAPQTKMWFGVLVENATQATARDVLTNAWKNVADAGFNVIFTVHDEIVVEVDEAGAEDAKEKICEIMRREPAWMPGLPLEVEAEITKFYKK